LYIPDDVLKRPRALKALLPSGRLYSRDTELGKKNHLPLYELFLVPTFIVKASVATPFIEDGLSVRNFWCSIIDLIIPSNASVFLSESVHEKSHGADVV
jgi:hypothetical protein